MGKRLRWLSLGLLGIGALVAVTGGSAAHTPAWGNVIEVPGIAALTHPWGESWVRSVSCASAGNCAAVGNYYDSKDGRYRAFVVDETNGEWGTAAEVSVAGGAHSYLFSVSCATAGNCSAGGTSDSPNRRHSHAFVVNETNGTWGKAIELSGTADLGWFDAAGVNAVSCGAPGDCAAVGRYVDRSHYVHAFLVDETNGKWGIAIAVPGLDAINRRGSEAVAVSCAAARECTAVGNYGGSPQLRSPAPPDTEDHRAFVVDEVDGSWGPAIELPGTAAQSDTTVNALSCASPGNCAAGGEYSDRSFTGNPQRPLDNEHAFVADETDGSWGDAIEVPGIAALPQGGDAWVDSVSCASPRNCAAVGTIWNSRGPLAHPFVVDETNGRWGDAIAVSGVSDVSSVSCGAPGSCATGGDEGDWISAVNETNGTWGSAIEVPGERNPLYASIESISCATPDSCVAGGHYADMTPDYDRAFVVTYRSP